MLMNPPQFIFKKNERHNHIRKQLKLILKILTHLKRETKKIQLNGGQSMKLYKKIISKNLIFFQMILLKSKDNANEAINIPTKVKIT